MKRNQIHLFIEWPQNTNHVTCDSDEKAHNHRSADETAGRGLSLHDVISLDELDGQGDENIK